MDGNEILAVATRTRTDFESKSLEMRYVQGLVEKHLSYIAESYGSGLTVWIGQMLATFPVNGCELAAAVLLDRLQTGEIVYGRYDYGSADPLASRKSHSFWRQTEHGGNGPLIADLTADQYGGPPVYVGGLVEPWTIPDWTAVYAAKFAIRRRQQ